VTLKNFKVKILANELLTHLTKHYRNPTKYKNYLCLRCQIVSEDFSHIITCLYNQIRLETLIQQAIQKISRETESNITNIDNFIYNYKVLYLVRGCLIGFITEDTIAPFENIVQKKKFTSLLHHTITSSIYDEIWLPSRQYTHETFLPDPKPLQPLILDKTSNNPLALLSSKLHNYITYNYLTLQQIYKD